MGLTRTFGDDVLTYFTGRVDSEFIRGAGITVTFDVEPYAAGANFATAPFLHHSG